MRMCGYTRLAAGICASSFAAGRVMMEEGDTEAPSPFTLRSQWMFGVKFLSIKWKRERFFGMVNVSVFSRMK